MAGERIPGPVCQVERPLWVQNGTTCIAPAHSPIPGGVDFEAAGVHQRISGNAGEAHSRDPVLARFEEAPFGSGGFNEEMSGSILFGVGSELVRVKIPGTSGLYVQFPGAATANGRSPLFILDSAAKRHFRLDYVPNHVTRQIDYQWIEIPAGSGPARRGAPLNGTTRHFRYRGRVLVVAGLADSGSLVTAAKRWRQTARAANRGIATIEPGEGVAIRVVRGLGGYAGDLWVAGPAFDWVEETCFERVPEVIGGD
jgi:hypothetical protein